MIVIIAPDIQYLLSVYVATRSVCGYVSVMSVLSCYRQFCGSVFPTLHHVNYYRNILVFLVIK
jgi:hypothetical protein